MSDNKKLYRQILQSTTLFGSVQIFNIIISVARSKVIALLIGPLGMGIAGLLNAAISVIGGITSLGLETSAVKYISQTNELDDKAELNKIVAVLRKTVWFTGFAGAFSVIILSPWLSILTFGNSDYTYWFIWLSVTLLFKQLTIGQFAVLQGLRKLKQLANANFMGSLFGFLISIPIYWYYGINAIVPAIVVSSLAALFFSWYYSRDVVFDPIKLRNRQALREGKGMINLGVLLSLSGLIATFSLYVLQIYISSKSDLVETGLYNAGFLLLNSYVGMIFAAMGTDYFPRLAAISDDNSKVSETVGHQAQIGVLLLTPIIVLFLIFAPLIVRILFSSDFLAIIPMISLGIIGMLFRAASWSVGYVLIAKGDSKLFIRSAFGFNAIFLLLHVMGYYFYGLTGLGAAFAVHYILHFIILKFIAQKRYGLYFSRDFLLMFGLCFLLCIGTLMTSYIDNPLIKYLLFAVLAITTIGYALIQLNKRINLREFVSSKLSKND